MNIGAHSYNKKLRQVETNQPKQKQDGIVLNQVEMKHKRTQTNKQTNRQKLKTHLHQVKTKERNKKKWDITKENKLEYLQGTNLGGK